MRRYACKLRAEKISMDLESARTVAAILAVITASIVVTKPLAFHFVISGGYLEPTLFYKKEGLTFNACYT